VTATCPPGERAISDGFNTGLFAAADNTGPTSDGSGWFITADTGFAAAAVSAVAVCVAP